MKPISQTAIFSLDYYVDRQRFRELGKKMAYAAVVSLMQLVKDYLISFPCRLLVIEKERGESFHKKAEKVLNNFKNFNCFPNPYLTKLKEEFEPLTLTIDKDFEKAARQALLPSYLLIEKEELPEIHGTLYKIDGVNSSLQAIVDLPISATLSQQRCRDFANVLLSANKEIKRVITLFNQVAKEGISLYDRVGALLQKLKESNHDQVVNCIKFAADKASDSMEDFLTGHPFLLGKEDLLELPAMEIHPQKRVKNIFDLLKDIDRLLSDTLEEISSISSENENHKAFSALQLYGDTQPESSRRRSQLLSTSETDSQICEFMGIIGKKQEDIVVGHDECISKIIDELIGSPSGLTIVGIAGMGGIGKTTLAKQVFHHAQIVHHFHCLAWVNIVSNIRDLLLRLLDSITPSRDEIHGQTNEDMGQILWRSLKGRKYLIVMDNLWGGEALDAIQRYFPDDRVGSRILITSRFMEFPTSTLMIPKNPPHCIKLLNEDQSWELLEKLVFGKESCPLELVNVGKRIAENCGGLPLAIVVIAGTLLRIPMSYSFWLSIMDSINSIVSANPNGCLDILALSYNYLPLHLKACFLLMGAFPANCEIEVQKLMNLWIAEGFLDCKSSYDSEMVAADYLEDLIGRSLVSVEKRSFDGKIKTCLIHDLLRHVCLREAQKENFMHVLEADANPQGLDRQRRLIFNLDNCADMQILPPLPHLRSFIWLSLGSDFTPGMVILQLSGFKLLRVLDMYFLPLDTFPEQLLNLVNLRYLALNVSYVLDDRILQLKKLQTLMIYGPWIPHPTLCLQHWRMPWLRHVNFSVPIHTRVINYASEERTNTQTLSTITFSSCTWKFISFMRNLKKIGVSETREDYENGESANCFKNLSSLTKLEILKCSFYKGNSNARSTTTSWRMFPVYLKKLSLSGSHFSWDEMKVLANLRNLEILKLKDHAFQGPEWVLIEEEVFCRLKRLLIDNTDLIYWKAERIIHFPCLERLVLRSCKSLEKIPCGVGELSVLELIELHYCSESAENSAREFEEYYGSPKVIITRSNN